MLRTCANKESISLPQEGMCALVAIDPKSIKEERDCSVLYVKNKCTNVEFRIFIIF